MSDVCYSNIVLIINSYFHVNIHSDSVIGIKNSSDDWSRTIRQIDNMKKKRVNSFNWRDWVIWFAIYSDDVKQIQPKTFNCLFTRRNETVENGGKISR